MKKIELMELMDEGSVPKSDETENWKDTVEKIKKLCVRFVLNSNTI